MEIQRVDAGARLSQAVKAGGLVFTVGQVATRTPGADVVTQVKDILDQIDGLLGKTGSSKELLVSATVYLADLAHFNDLNSVWDKWVVPGSTPARTTIHAQLLSPDYAVEIAVVAAAL
ncbi:enamine deaminase RidA (YjgF/YER057c/UK114 family) [Paraburkholderia sp. BL18I3N2]|uniref:RidA family protein n=1 Tax=Paraburkholderia sp. BL18I3N2 TaxID=1938799 RepID=UPI000D05EDA2|nr:RidA family protein [Paraburkholderia sp. BL18I3N2]PRX21645.1 enamine deaminase RidA (YjgF/YER057c/UK114 family) [Paraburkholderia sp. BL18I3N2]